MGEGEHGQTKSILNGVWNVWYGGDVGAKLKIVKRVKGHIHIQYRYGYGMGMGGV